MLVRAVSGLSLSAPAEYQALPKGVLVSRLAEDEVELTRIRYQAAGYQALAEENASLRTALGVPHASSIATGRVIARPSHTHYDTVLVAIDASRGVVVGDRAAVGAVAVGTVTAVSGGTALVTLYSSPGTTVDGAVGSPQSIVVLTGVGGGAFEAVVPAGTVLEQGDTIHHEGINPDALAVVSAIAPQADQGAVIVYAHLPIAISDLTYIDFFHP